MSDPRHRHPYDCIAFLDQRWDAMTAEMRAKAVQVEAELHMRIAALTSELAEARAERDSLAETRAALTANLNALTVDVATMRAERDAARRALADAIYERDDALRKKRDAQAERDAYRDGRYAGPWQPVADHHNGEGYSRAGAAFVGLRRDGRYEWNCAGFKSALVETAAEAKAAADAHLIAAGWFLAGGPHGAGEAK